MKYLRLGTTDIDISQVALGCMSLTREKEESSRRTVRRAFDEGITFFDTADVYGRGVSEEILGETLKSEGIPREKVVIATKCGIVFEGMEPRYDFKAYDLSAEYIKSSVESSLKRLQTDYIDLYQPHRIDYLAHPEETARALEELKTEGKIRCVGVSNYTEAEIRALSSYTQLESLQTQFSLLHLEPLETGLASVCLEKRMNLLCWSPNARGLLTGIRGLEHGDWQAQRNQGVVAQVGELAEQYEMTIGQVALAWLMQLPGGVIPLVGTANPDHIAEAAGAADKKFDRDDWYELMVIARGRPMPWGQSPYFYLKEK